MPELHPHHTFQLPASCKALVHFDSVDQLRALVAETKHFYLLGEGSNTLFIEDYPGTVLVNKIAGIETAQTDDAYLLRVGAGENWHSLVTTALENGWYGMENLALIPGSVGASPIQNIGAYGLEVAQFIASVEMLNLATGEIDTLYNTDCAFGYRDSIFKHALAGKVIITHVNFSLPKAYQANTSYGELKALADPSPEAIYQEVIRVRQQKLPDPKMLGNAGSFFKNPVISAARYAALQSEFADIPGYAVGNEQVKVPAAWLIDQAGFKGHQLGQVRCHPTQPLVLTNLGGATGKDVVTLARAILDKVNKQFEVTLEPEVRLLGQQGLITL